MQLLTFQIGAHLLAVPARRVLSVGREGTDRGAAIDLAALLDPDGRREEQRPVIRYDDGSRTVELTVDRILALVNCEDSAVQPWPCLLKPLSFFTGAVTIDGRLFQVIDIATLMARGKGRRR